MQKHVFISHSTTDAPIVEEVCHKLEADGTKCWLAKRDALSGESYPRSIMQAIRDAGALVLVFTEHSNRSKHVHREIERAISFSIPIIVLRVENIPLAEELEYFISLNHWLDATARPISPSLNTLSRRLSDLLASSNPVFNLSSPSKNEPRQPARDVSQPNPNVVVGFSELADRHQRLLANFGHEVLEFVCSRSSPSSPISPNDLLRGLASAKPELFSNMASRQFAGLLTDARSNGCLPGLVHTSHGLAIVEENIAWKLERNRQLKEQLGEFAAQQVSSGCRLAMDGGSTTLPIARSLCSRLDEGSLDQLTVVTNSLAVASEFGQLMSNRGWTDDDCPVTVLLTGGWLRPNTQALADRNNLHACNTSLRLILSGIGELDTAFIGANGFTAAGGLTMGSSDELPTKRMLMECTKNVFFVADIKKAGVTLSTQIASWNDKFTLITNNFDLSPELKVDLDQLIHAGRILLVGNHSD